MNGVIEINTGDLLRYGHCDFENDGSFDPENESIREDVPEEAKVRSDSMETEYHRWTGNEWILISKITLEIVKETKIIEIDARTVELIREGFPYNGFNFSMSDAAQRNWIGLLSANTAGMLSFPFTISTVDEGTYELQDVNDLIGFEGAFMVYQTDPNQPLGAGRVLKAQVNACETIACVEAIVDDR